MRFFYWVIYNIKVAQEIFLKGKKMVDDANRIHMWAGLFGLWFKNRVFKLYDSIRKQGSSNLFFGNIWKFIW